MIAAPRADRYVWQLRLRAGAAAAVRLATTVVPALQPDVLSRVHAWSSAFCAMQRWVGVPCPGCGVTRGVVALLQGRFGDAYAANPAAPLVVAFLIGQLVTATAAWRGARPSRVMAALRWQDSGLTVALLVVWIARLLS